MRENFQPLASSRSSRYTALVLANSSTFSSQTRTGLKRPTTENNYLDIVKSSESSKKKGKQLKSVKYSVRECPGGYTFCC